MAMRPKVLVAAVVLFAWCAGLAPAEDAAEKTSGEWLQQLKAWRKQIGTPVRWDAECKAAMEKVRAVSDPAAMSPLMVMFRQEKDHSVKRRYVQALGAIAVTLATSKDEKAKRDVLEHLVRISVEEEQALRKEATTQLTDLPYLRDALPQYIRYLRSKWVNRAAEALSKTKLTRRKRYEKPDRNLTYALIDSLVVVRPKKIPVELWYHYLYPTNSAVGQRWGYRRGVVEVDGEYRVPSVLNALKEYSGSDHGYDRAAWRSWYAKQAKSQRRSTEID